MLETTVAGFTDVDGQLGDAAPVIDVHVTKPVAP